MIVPDGVSKPSNAEDGPARVNGSLHVFRIFERELYETGFVYGRKGRRGSEPAAVGTSAYSNGAPASSGSLLKS